VVGYASAADFGNLEALPHWSALFGIHNASALSLAFICLQADEKLLSNILLTYTDVHHSLLHQKEVNKNCYIIAITTCSFQFAPLPSRTITF